VTQRDTTSGIGIQIAPDLRTWRANVLNILLITVAIAAVPAVAFVFLQAIRDPNQWPAAFAFLALWLFVVVLTVFRRLNQSMRTWGLLLLGYAAGTIAFARGGLAGDGRVFFLALPVLALVLIGPRSALIMAVLTVFTFAVFAIMAQLGWLANWLIYSNNPLALEDWLLAGVVQILLLSAVVVLLWRFHRFQTATLEVAQKTTADLAQAQIHLHDRARELEDANRLLAQRPKTLVTAAEVGRAVTSILEADTLARQVVELIYERFGLYYVGLFLLDETGRYAVLGAGTGQAGRIMKEQGYKLEVGGASMVGAACAPRPADLAGQRPADLAGQRQARLAVDVTSASAAMLGAELVRFDNVLLPDTRSELALPLRVGDRVLGALDVQSTQPAAFSEEDIAALQLVADQVAVGLENARLFAQTRSSLDELTRLYRAMTGEAWQQFVQARPDLRRYQVGAAEVPEETWATLFAQARGQGQPVSVDYTGEEEDGGQHALAVPVKLRGTPVGVLGFHRPMRAGGWRPEEIALAESVADRVALALENARLLEEAQRRVARERLVVEITGRVRASTEVDAILRTAIQELGRALGASDGLIWLETDNGEAPPAAELEGAEVRP
jgi:GAF domain-containing protein